MSANSDGMRERYKVFIYLFFAVAETFDETGSKDGEGFQVEFEGKM